ncbi:nadph-dependent diflavin oxidoreductase 1 [Nannochloropsis oceanica]
MAQRLVVLYGSQTGTAQDMAEELGRKGKRRGFSPVEVQAWDSYDVTRLPEETFVLAVVSTTGDGEEPDNMRKSWGFLLRKALPMGSLSGLRFATFGLGDTSYPKFNAVARRLHIRLKQLGATPFVECGLGDDQSARGVLGDFDEWCQVMWPALHALCPEMVIPPNVDMPASEPVLYACRIEGTSTSNEKISTASNGCAAVDQQAPPWPGEAGADQEYDLLEDLPGFYQKPHGARNPSSQPFLARLMVNKRLTPDDWFQETRHLEWDLRGFTREEEGSSRSKSSSGSSSSCNGHSNGDRKQQQQQQQQQQAYKAGDVAHLYPQNPPEAVSAILALLSLQPTDKLYIERLPEPSPPHTLPPRDLPPTCTAFILFLRYLDITAVPKRALLEQLALLATNEEEREKLFELASPDGADLYNDYCYREKRSLVEVLQDFPSARPSLPQLLTLLPRLRPRAFSIASTCHPSGPTPHQLHLCVAVVSFRTPYKRQRRGLCSSYLASLPVGRHVPLWIKPGSFVLPASPWTPLVMVGPGTGIAPFKAMVEERAAQRKEEEEKQLQQVQIDGQGIGGERTRVPPFDRLFFGCRKEQVDFYYRAELEKYTQGGGKEGGGGREGELALVTAFSRDQEGGRKVYVTHRLEEEGAVLWRLLGGEGRGEGGKASFFVAGSAKRMPTDVFESLKGVAVREGGLSEVEATKFLDRLVRARRYCVESWAV